MMRQIVEAAAELGVGVNTHLSETADEVAQSLQLTGMTPIAYMQEIGLFAVPTVAAHCVHATPAEITIMAERGVGVAHCPSSNMKLGSGIAPVPAMLNAGVTVGLGTDGAGSNNTLDVMREMRQTALMHKVGGDPTAVNAMQALTLATRGGARAMRQPDLGALRAGMLADVILVDLNGPHLQPGRGRVPSHLVYAAYGSDVDTTIVHGQVLMEGRRLLTLDVERIAAKVGESADRLFS